MDRIQHLKQFIEEDPSDVFSRYALALEMIKKGELQQAKEQMIWIRKSHPDYLANYYHFGKLCLQMEKVEEAKELFSEGMEVARQQANHQALSELTGALEEMHEGD